MSNFKSNIVCSTFSSMMDNVVIRMTGSDDSLYKIPDTIMKEILSKPINKMNLENRREWADKGWYLLINDHSIDLNCIRPILLYYLTPLATKRIPSPVMKVHKLLFCDLHFFISQLTFT